MLRQTIPSIDEIYQSDFLKVTVLKADLCPFVDLLVHGSISAESANKRFVRGINKTYL